jgi:DNA (cytosine-5)-methyltransferase 1
LKFISLFAGIGGFDLALKREGHNCVWANEWDKYAAQIYDKNFDDKIDQRDIRTVPVEEIPDHDLLVGGFPCQSFSIAGKREGFNDTRGTLFFEIARIVKQKRPHYLLLENVKGLLSHEQGRTFTTIISTLDELGYDCQWQVLNSKNFGVPQNRERVFIIGNLRGEPRPKIFPICGANKICYQRVSDKETICQTLKARYPADWNGNYIRQLNNPRHSNNRVYDPSGICPCLRTMQGGNRQPKIVQLPRGKNHGGNHVIAPTLTGKSYQDNNHVDGIRRLTPLECERLQGFPDGWTKWVSDSQRYKCLGNAVTVNVVQYIVKNCFSDFIF